MRKKSAAIFAAIALVAELVHASPAAARPADCTLTVKISPDPGAMYARADIRCTNAEHYKIAIAIYRKDWLHQTQVAYNYKSTYHQGYDYVSTSEPCSDVETSKKYQATAYLWDTTYGPPAEIRDVDSPIISGHC